MTILQSRLSGMYFKDFGLWVARAAEALRFETPDCARKFVTSENLSDVAVLDADNLATPAAGDKIFSLGTTKLDAA